MNNNNTSQIKAYIDLNAFNHNINIIKNKFPKAMIILPVKANAYGHGDLIIANEAQKIGIEYLAIARLHEGIKLRKNGIRIPIINFGVEYDEFIDLSFDFNIELSINSLDYAKLLEKKAKSRKIKAQVHLKIDTGMRRLGCRIEDALKTAKFIYNSNFLTLKSVYTHFAKSDEDIEYTKDQMNLFLKFKDQLRKERINPEFFHCFNSGSIIKNPEVVNNSFAIRPGIMAYGYSPFNDDFDYGLIPVMTLRTKIINLKSVPKDSGVSYNHTYITKKKTVLATIPLGYGDGFHRSLSNKFMVTINNKNYKQVGTISMDLSVIEVDHKIKIGDEVFIFGKKEECINDAKKLAKLINTICYEITTSLTDRVERVIKN